MTHRCERMRQLLQGGSCEECMPFVRQQFDQWHRRGRPKRPTNTTRGERRPSTLKSTPARRHVLLLGDCAPPVLPSCQQTLWPKPGYYNRIYEDPCSKSHHSTRPNTHTEKLPAAKASKCTPWKSYPATFLSVLAFFSAVREEVEAA